MATSGETWYKVPSSAQTHLHMNTTTNAGLEGKHQGKPWFINGLWLKENLLETILCFSHVLLGSYSWFPSTKSGIFWNSRLSLMGTRQYPSVNIQKTYNAQIRSWVLPMEPWPSWLHFFGNQLASCHQSIAFFPCVSPFGTLVTMLQPLLHGSTSAGRIAQPQLHPFRWARRATKPAG